MQDTLLTLDSHPEGSSAAEVSSGSTEILLTARSATQQASAQTNSHKGAATFPAPARGDSRGTPRNSSDQGLPEQPPAGRKCFPSCQRPNAPAMSRPAGALNAELGTLSAAGSSSGSDENNRKVYTSRIKIIRVCTLLLLPDSLLWALSLTCIPSDRNLPALPAPACLSMRYAMCWDRPSRDGPPPCMLTHVRSAGAEQRETGGAEGAAHDMQQESLAA